MTYTLAIDEDARRVLLAALDLYQRVAMGQWDGIVEHAPNVLPDDQTASNTPAGQALLRVRCQFADSYELREWPAAYLSITRAQPDAQAAYDLWHLLGGGMRDRRDDRISTVEASIVPDPWQTAT